MTPNGVAEQSPYASRLDADSAFRWLVNLLRVFRPSDGWLATILMVLNLMIVVWSVDLVGQDHLRHDRSGPKLEFSVLLAVNRDSGHVAGQ